MNPTATPTADGDAYDLNATAVLLLLASNAYGEASHYTPPAGQARGAKAVADLLAAAGAGGYPRADILETLLRRGETGPRVTAMCAEAMAAAGSERIALAFAAIRQSIRG